jgi:DNA-binding CsgD family transcriptional regulator
MLQSIGSSRFADALLDLVQSEFGVVELGVWELHGDMPRPSLFASRKPGARERLEAYCGAFHRGDVVFAALATAPPGRIVSTCRRICQSPISAYRALFHADGGLDEVVSLAFRADRLTVLNLYCPRGSSIGEDALAQLNAMGLTLMAAVRAHGETRRRAGAHVDGTIPPLPMVEEMLRKMRPDLTARETEVCARTVIGMTAYAISLDLDISVSTVTTYRRRAYARMGICSAYELLGSLISASDARLPGEFIPARAA